MTVRKEVAAAGSSAGAGAPAGSVLDFFRIGLGPSSSHTVGPMRAGREFCEGLRADGLLDRTVRVRVKLHGSLAATGIGHGTDRAVVLGLSGLRPESADPLAVPGIMARVRETSALSLLGEREVAFDLKDDLQLVRRPLTAHPNGMSFAALDATGEVLREEESYSVGGGFVVRAAELADGAAPAGAEAALPHPYATGAELLERCEASGLGFAELTLENERAIGREPEEVRARLLEVWGAMSACIDAGCRNEGTLPGGLNVARRAPGLAKRLAERDGASGEAQNAAEPTAVAEAAPVARAGPGGGKADPLGALDWVTLYAIAVNEENAAGGRVVTAPTNGAAGVVPAVLRYFADFCAPRPGRAMDDEAVSFLLAAGAVCALFKRNASISGAEVGCQGEIGSACAMAAAGLAEVMGGTPKQVENAAEIGLEHNLGLTCDPIGGLVQIPCIERNAQAAVKAINAARIALSGDGEHFVSLDSAIRTMWETGQDMKLKYKETSRGGLATAVMIPVSAVEC